MSIREYQQRLVARFKPDGVMIFLTLAIWMCTLPLIFMVALPFLGWRWTGVIAGAILLAELIVCWALCLVNIHWEAKKNFPGRTKYGN